MQQPTIILTHEQIDFFHRDGYLVIPAITTPEEVQSLCQLYDHLFSSKAGRDRGDHLDLSSIDDGSEAETLPQILNPAKYAPELADTLFRANAEAIAAQLLGPETRFTGDHAIRKPPHSGAETPWHQDEAYWAEDLEYNALSIWIPLQEATLENGCMQFVPGSHNQEILPHHSIGHDPRIIGLEVDNVEALTARAVACPIPAGGATIHHSRTLHYTGPNRSAGARRAYILGFGTPARKRQVSRDFYWLKMQRTQWHERVKAAEEAQKSGGV
jgi:ectoine hydroxylase-related dioxygenase (phytanoyl-CoA dioxygenase family)